MKPNIAVQRASRSRDPGDPDDRAPRQRARRLRAHRRAVRHDGRPDPRAAARAVTTSTRAKNIIGRRRMLELKLVEAGPAPDQARLLQPHNGAGPARHGSHPGRRRRRRRRRRSTWCGRSPAVTGRDLRNARPTLDEYNTPAVSFTLNSEGVAKFSRVDRRPTSAGQLAIVLDNQRAVGAASSTARYAAPRRRITGTLHAAGGQRPRAGAAVGRAAGVAHLSRAARGRARRSARTRFAPASWRRSSASVLVTLFMLIVLQAGRHQRVRLGRAEPRDSDGLHGVSRRRHDAARHRRLHPDDRHGRGLERPDLRAHP